MILDSGDRREFPTGAVRDIQVGKGRCDLMPLDVVCILTGGDEIILSLYSFRETGAVFHLYNALKHFQKAEYDNMESMILSASKHFEDGAKKYGENNWQKGLPVSCYIDSALRHYLKYLRCDEDEPHHRAFVWNIMCCIWTCMHKPEMNNYASQ